MDKKEAIFWSIAFPGFGQFLNGHIVKGVLFILLEIIINVQSKFNLAIMASFQGNISYAFDVINYQWLMFYPCLYFFAMYDAYHFANGKNRPYIFLPFVFCAYFVTIGLMIASKIRLGQLIGPVFLPMVFVIPGLISGIIIRKIFIHIKKDAYH